jgi:hypothetical protein
MPASCFALSVDSLSVLGYFMFPQHLVVAGSKLKILKSLSPSFLWNFLVLTGSLPQGFKTSMDQLLKSFIFN